eukprot:SAG31_NODE_2807_length_5065_cov_3.438180_2_plen_106_part_00
MHLTLRVVSNRHSTIAGQTDDVNTPVPTAFAYTGEAQCPGGRANRPCTIHISGTGGAEIIQELQPLTQDGPHEKDDQVNICQWYDSNYDHPMATFGMGHCDRTGA